MAKKIGAIVSLSIIGILILATIIMANIDVRYNVKCATPTSILLNYNSNDANSRRIVDNEKEIINYINNASKEKALTALFNGTLNKEPKLVVDKKSGQTLPSNTGFYVWYGYENTQEVKDSNGNKVAYDYLVFTVTKTDGVEPVRVFLITDSAKPTTYSYYYELEADFADLYNYLERTYNA